MKILALADEESPALWEYYVPGRLKEYDLVISCGDLSAKYLEFIATMGRAPVVYVPGNHDVRYTTDPPEGCDCIDGQFVTFNGVRILGLGGCRWYRPGPYQVTEKQMRKKIRRLKFQLWRHKGVDIVVTHAPPEGVGDGEDNAHRGFEALIDLIDKYKPTYLLHGHVHANYDSRFVREREYNGTKVINVGERYTMEIPEGQYKPKDYFQVKYKTRQQKHDEDDY